MKILANGAKEPVWNNQTNLDLLKKYIVSNAEKNIDFVTIRENIKELSEFPDGHIHQLIIDLGYEVER